MTDIEKEIDRRIQLMGIRLGQEEPGQRERIRLEIELDEARRENRRLQGLLESAENWIKRYEAQ